jgi:alpha-beta hydrolase superfamily lysophospholipase
MSKPSVVVVPGAWQKPAAFVTIVEKLTAAGYPSEHVSMPTVGGTELPLAGLEDDVAAVQAVLTRLTKEGKKVVLVGHSSGGLVSSNAVVGFDGVSVIYLSAFMVSTFYSRDDVRL